MLHLRPAFSRNQSPIRPSSVFRAPGRGLAVPDEIYPDSVNGQLERILSTPPLASSPSLSRFLRYLVEETLAGRAQSITEYALGVRVFNRREEFNPRTDPLVRVQTHHLRARLVQFYSGPGAGDSVRIELPARTYVPVFRQEEAPLGRRGETSVQVCDGVR